ncbi:hypothetical protein Bca52824_000081 [Brassica carinata]|uniref:Xylanase inhibitor N-terminal domain-containing protein n=1 Tax=Brassica carinata TaxID=52824 RepID=A0A8X7WG72_BRACI|nr:hypothetical protein Bca52824_000081 [Brassica carinata]
MVLDTGSELSWLHCRITSTSTSIFDHAKSSSYTALPCSSPVCTTQTQDLTVPATCDKKELISATWLSLTLMVPPWMGILLKRRLDSGLRGDPKQRWMHGLELQHYTRGRRQDNRFNGNEPGSVIVY